MFYQSAVFKVAFVVALLALALEGGVRVWEVASGAPNTVYDIQTPAHLITRIESFARHRGPKIAVIGDSVVYGASMGEHGDGRWLQHTMSAQLEQCLIAGTGKAGPRVENFGLNGVLPTEIEKLVDAVLTTGPDAVIFDIGIRSFSADFEPPGKRASRSWLETFERTGTGAYRWTSDSKLGAVRFNDAVDAWLLGFWHTYRWRETLQAIWFGGKPADWARRTRDGLDQWFLGLDDDHKAARDSEETRLLEMLKIKKRYKSIAFSPDRHQTSALVRTLNKLEKSAVPTVLFYAKENPSRIGKAISSRKYRVVQQTLHDLLKPFLGQDGRMVMVDRLETLDAPRFLDLVHVDAKGYGQYAAALLGALRSLSGRASMQGSSLQRDIFSGGGERSCGDAVAGAPHEATETGDVRHTSYRPGAQERPVAS